MKKLLQAFLLVLIVSLSMVLTSCDNSNTLYILNWDEYIDEELIVEFEQEFNCNVVLDIAQSNETMFSKIVSDSAPYDIAFPSDYMIGQMLNCDDEEVDAPIIKKIDFTKLDNYDQMMFDENLMSMIKKDCPELIDYCVPYFWGSLGIMYNTKNLNENQVNTIKEKGWNVLFEKELLGNVKVGMYASARDSIAAGLLYNGYSLNTKDDNELQKAGDALFKMNYHAWATDDLKTGVAAERCVSKIITEMGVMEVTEEGIVVTELHPDFTKEDIQAATGCELIFSPDLKPYDVEDEEVEITFDMVAPDTNNVFFDAMVIPRNSMNEDLAYKFINFMISEEKALQNAQYVGYCPTIKSVCEEMLAELDYIGEDALDVYYPGDLSNGEIYKYLGTETYSVYDSIYKKVKK